jgi:sporulation protein YlmC with PRC-barrel domain
MTLSMRRAGRLLPARASIDTVTKGKKRESMKQGIQYTICSALTALSLGAFIVTASAKDESPSGAAMGASHNLGKVERASKVLGKEVMSSDNQKVGKIDDLVVDLESGHILYVVANAAHGKVALAPEILSEPSDNNVHANANKQKLDSAPQFTSDVDKPDQLGQASFVSGVYQYFGQSSWWQGHTAANTGAFNNVHKVSDLDGMKVLNESNQTIAKVADTAVELPHGRVVYVILNPDSSLKLGNNYYAQPPNALSWNANQKALISGVTREQLASAPHFSKDNWSTLSSPTFAAKVYQYYGKQPWFQPGGLQPTGR